MNKAMTYVPVSSQQQGRSGLGINAQKDAIARFAVADGIEIIRHVRGIETGKGADALNSAD